jgi:hypothetical protein
MQLNKSCLVLGFTVLFSWACKEGEGGTCGRLAEEDAKCSATPNIPAFHVCEDESQTPPSDDCVMLGESGDYCCPEGFGGGDPPAGPGLDPDILPVDNTGYQPPLTASWQWQLDGTINTAYAVEVYDVDLFDTDATVIAGLQADGKRVICYFSAGSAEDWRSDYKGFAPSAMGLEMDGWAGERWVDVTDTSVLDVMLGRLDLAVDKGCDGVEPDNVDGFANNTGFQLTGAHQLGFNKRLANEAHQRGLAVLLKNDLGQIVDLVDYFDGVLDEECFYYDECDKLTPFIDAGKPVFQAEYAEDSAGGEQRAAEVCGDARARNFHTLVLPWDLDDSFRFSCDEADFDPSDIHSLQFAPLDTTVDFAIDNIELLKLLGHCMQIVPSRRPGRTD